MTQFIAHRGNLNGPEPTFQLIIEFENNPNLYFDLYNNQLTTNLKSLINNIHDKEYVEHGVFATYDSIIDPHNRILKSKRLLARLGVDIEWPDNVKSITRDLLNYLHLEFHKSSDKDYSSDIMKIFVTVNHDIHIIEGLMGTESKNSYWVVMTNDKQLNKVPIVPIDTNDYLDLFKHNYVADQPKTTLVLGYATIGKHLGHCVVDNDVQAVIQNHLSPQVHMNTEIIVRHCDTFSSQQDVDNANANIEQQIISWVNINDLHKYVDISDKRNLIAVQPVIGQICKQQETLTEYNLYERFRGDNIKTIKVI